MVYQQLRAYLGFDPLLPPSKWPSTKPLTATKGRTVRCKTPLYWTNADIKAVSKAFADVGPHRALTKRFIRTTCTIHLHYAKRQYLRATKESEDGGQGGKVNCPSPLPEFSSYSRLSRHPPGGLVNVLRLPWKCQ